MTEQQPQLTPEQQRQANQFQLMAQMMGQVCYEACTKAIADYEAAKQAVVSEDRKIAGQIALIDSAYQRKNR